VFLKIDSALYFIILYLGYKDSANEDKENVFLFCRVQPILCKDSANEDKENVFLFCRVQPILCKDTTKKRVRRIISR